MKNITSTWVVISAITQLCSHV